MLDGQKVPLRAEPADHTCGHSRNEGMMTEFFALVDIRDVHLQNREFARIQRIEHGD